MPKVDSARGEEALAFLARHRLEPTPQNYTLAYIALFEPESVVAKTVRELTADGFRLKQEEADGILGAQSGRSGPSESSEEESPDHEALRHQAIRLGEAASSAAAATGAFARELSEGAESIGDADIRMVQIVTGMIERSRTTESELSSAAKEIATLRLELESARDDAQRDQLTRLGNRRAIERHLQQLADKGAPRILGLCDIDHFKAINDRYGHGVGDRVLKQVATALQDSCTPSFVGRWGGEEFLVVLESDEIEAGRALLDRARTDLARREFKLRETDEPMGQITFSGGIALSVGDYADSISALHRADAAMYRAKNTGRNQICLA